MAKRNEDGNGNETKGKLDDDINALFALSSAEFTGARNALAARLKQGGRGDEADRVKALVKPSISAWAVNQLYWKHRKAFDRLIATGQRVRQAQALQFAGKVSDMRGPLDARREALLDLSHLAAALLRDAGHNPTPDMMRRIATTLEAMSANASLTDTPLPGRLTADLDPPGFESLAALIPGAGIKDRTEGPARVSPFQKSASATTNSRKDAPVSDIRELEETRQTRIAGAKVSLQNAERVRSEARARAQGAEVALKKANAAAKQAEKHKREAEERFETASAASEEAGQRARRVAAEAAEATKILEDADRAVEKASKELRSLRPKVPARR
ncbi:MAG TPA: hypothetical protein VGQ19_19070 [Burkholderiales bacterium]|nr:hypothetical protein [Burkholderiales bacterium]